MNRRKVKVRDVLYPFLKDIKVFDASGFLSGTQAVIRQIYMDGMRFKKLNEIVGKDSSNSPYPELTDIFLKNLDEESVESALWMLDQVMKSVEEFKNHEAKGRTVGSYKTEFNAF